MANLITYLDIIKYKPVSANSNMAKKIDTCILEAQELDLRPFLGPALYYDILKTPTKAEYVQLLDGMEYVYDGKTLLFTGVKKLLCYYSYARYVMDANIEETATGLVHKSNNYSEQISEKSILRKQDQASSAAYAFQKDAEEFLNRKSTSTYLALWKNNCTSEVKRRRPRITGVGE